MKYKNIEKTGIKEEELAKLLGYSSLHSFRNTKNKDKFLSGIDKLLEMTHKSYDICINELYSIKKDLSIILDKYSEKPI